MALNSLNDKIIIPFTSYYYRLNEIAFPLLMFVILYPFEH